MSKSNDTLKVLGRLRIGSEIRLSGWFPSLRVKNWSSITTHQRVHVPAMTGFVPEKCEVPTMTWSVFFLSIVKVLQENKPRKTWLFFFFFFFTRKKKSIDTWTDMKLTSHESLFDLTQSYFNYEYSLKIASCHISPTPVIKLGVLSLRQFHCLINNFSVNSWSHWHITCVNKSMWGHAGVFENQKMKKERKRLLTSIWIFD